MAKNLLLKLGQRMGPAKILNKWFQGARGVDRQKRGRGGKREKARKHVEEKGCNRTHFYATLKIQKTFQTKIKCLFISRAIGQ